MSVPTEVRLLLLQAAALFFGFGIAWIRGLPRYNSVWGLRFREATASEAAWRKLHRESGWVLVLGGLWLALPFPTVDFTTRLQIPGFAFLTFLGVVLVRLRASS